MDVVVLDVVVGAAVVDVVVLDVVVGAAVVDVVVLDVVVGGTVVVVLDVVVGGTVVVVLDVVVVPEDDTDAGGSVKFMSRVVATPLFPAITLVAPTIDDARVPDPPV